MTWITTPCWCGHSEIGSRSQAAQPPETRNLRGLIRREFPRFSPEKYEPRAGVRLSLRLYHHRLTAHPEPSFGKSLRGLWGDGGEAMADRKSVENQSGSQPGRQA